MSYQVVKKSVPAIMDGVSLGFNVQRYYVTFGGSAPEDGKFGCPFVEVWKDNSVTLNHRGVRFFLYSDEWGGIINALVAARNDIKNDTERLLKERLAETMDSTVFHGVRVDLSRREVIEAVTTCEITTELSEWSYARPFIMFNGHRRSLSRTDLKDDVSTVLCENKTAEEWRAYYLAKAKRCMGARLYSGDGRLRFSIIDSFSDG